MAGEGAHFTASEGSNRNFDVNPPLNYHAEIINITHVIIVGLELLLSRKPFWGGNVWENVCMIIISPHIFPNVRDLLLSRNNHYHAENYYHAHDNLGGGLPARDKIFGQTPF